MAARKKIIRKKIKIKVNRNDLSYKKPENLAKFMNDRAKVFGRKQTGLSAKLQRHLTREVKRARHLGLLPFKAQI